MADDKKPGKGEPRVEPTSSKVDVESIRQLLALMGEHDLAELEIEQEGLVVRLRKAGAAAPQAVPVVPVAPLSPVGVPAPAAEARKAEELPVIKSPMVGTLYLAPSPEAPPFVKVGEHIGPDTVVCVIMAMKTVNEIRAEVSGTIEKVLAKNEQPVEFGTALFVVRPD
jgi:acetyl-CoA carboxylase biotin carboxyl carrier protein